MAHSTADPHCVYTVCATGTSAWDSTLVWAENHLRHLIQPLNASVFVAVTAANWCGPTAAAAAAVAAGRDGATRAALAHEVRLAFRHWHDLHTTFLPPPAGEADEATEARAVALARAGKARERDVGNFGRMIVNWR